MAKPPQAPPKMDQAFIDEMWRLYMTGGESPSSLKGPWYMARFMRPLARRLPSSPRCRLCFYPFKGIGGAVTRHLLGIEPSRLSPTLCNMCDQFAQAFEGGAEVETTLLFADVRGSTTLAEGMSPAQFSKVIGRFYAAASKALIDHNAMIEKLIGDEVTGFFVPGVAGPQHAQAAVEAAQALLKATGHETASGPWIPVGVGIHTGTAYIGSVHGDGGHAEIVVLGDAANTGARLASVAAAGEVVMSEAARIAAGLDPHGWEACELQLKGRAEPISAWRMHLSAPR